MIRSLDDLDWQPHAVLIGSKQALVNGCSVIPDADWWMYQIYGDERFKDAVGRYEIMTPDGTVHRHLTPGKALEIINA